MSIASFGEPSPSVSDPASVSDLATVNAARAAHTAHCADEIRRLRGKLASTTADRLRLVGAAATVEEKWTRLRQGAFTTCDPRALEHDEQLVLLALAAQDAADRPRIHVHGTARAVWRLPSIGPQTRLVEFARPPDATGRSPQARRRRTAIRPDSVDVGGLWVTGLDRTVIDRARYESLESAVAMSDAALRSDLIRQTDVLEQVHALPKRARGCKMAELAIALADGRAESPLESLSRIRMFQLGLPMPELQVEFFDASGFIGRVDFYWRQLGIIGEADGRVKFRVTEGLTGKEAEEAAWRAKRRDDRLLRHPDVQKVGHWDWGEALNPHVFVQVMAELGVRPVREGGWPVPDGPLPRKSMHVSVIERHTK